jgi:methylated-DNA-[protein]-cysteine S-methyltransferase
MNIIVTKSPLGKILLLSHAGNLNGLWFCESDPMSFLSELGYQDLQKKTDPVLDKTVSELNEYFEGTRKTFSVPLAYKATKFRRLAWESLQKIPYGQTRSYKAQAEMIGNPKASRAV